MQHDDAVSAPSSPPSANHCPPRTFASVLIAMRAKMHPVATTGSRRAAYEYDHESGSWTADHWPASASSGINIETIRYYERIRLLDAPPRTRGGHRSYDDADVRRLRFVRRARKLGFGIDDIRALLALAGQEGGSCIAVRDIAAHLTDIRAKLEDLQKLERILRARSPSVTSHCETTSAPVCPVIEVLQS